jgi:hypothetical protein
MSGATTSMQREVPDVGAHRDEVLSRALGLSREAIADLAGAGAFGKPTQMPREKQRGQSTG